MKNTLSFLVACACLLVCSCLSLPPVPKYTVKPSGELRFWEAQYATGNQQFSLVEYVAKGDSVKNWKELFSWQVFYGSGSPEKMGETILKSMEAQCGEVNASITRRSPDDVMIEYWHDGCGAFKGHHALRRIVKKDNDIYSIGYDVDNRNYSRSRYNSWKKQIWNMTLIPNPRR